MPLFVVEKKTDVVGRIIALGVDLLVGEKLDLRIGVAKQRDQGLRHRHAQAAAVCALELRRIGEPAHAVPQRADRQLDQHLLVAAVVIVGEDEAIADERLDAHPDVVALGAADPALRDGRLVQDVAGVEIGKPDAPGASALRHDDARAKVKIETQSVGARLGRELGGKREMRLRRRFRRARRAACRRGCRRG